MLQHSPGRVVRNLCFLIMAIIPGSPLCAQSLLVVEDDLNVLQACLGKEGPVVAQLRSGLISGYGQSTNSGLNAYGGHRHNSRAAGGYSDQQPLPPPQAYVQSLDRDVRVCQAAAKLKDPTQRTQALQAVAADIAIKANDCHKFGMGRMVPVRVTTLHGAAAESGWEIYYRWLISGGLQADELRAPQLTSPSRLQLPPGVYQFRAQKTGSPATQSVRVTVGMQPEMDIQLPIP